MPSREVSSPPLPAAPAAVGDPVHNLHFRGKERCPVIVDRPAGSQLVAESKRAGSRARVAWACVADPYLIDGDADDVWVSAVAALTGRASDGIGELLAGEAGSRSLPAKVAAAVVERLAVLGRAEVLAEVLESETRSTVAAAAVAPRLRHPDGSLSASRRRHSRPDLALISGPGSGSRGSSGPLGVGELFSLVVSNGWATLRSPEGSPLRPSGAQRTALAESLVAAFPDASVRLAVSMVGDTGLDAVFPHGDRFDPAVALRTLRNVCSDLEWPVDGCGVAGALSSSAEFARLDAPQRQLLVAWAASAATAAVEDGASMPHWSVADLEGALRLVVAAMVGSGREQQSAISANNVSVMALPQLVDSPHEEPELAWAAVQLLCWLVSADPAVVSDPARVGRLFGVTDLAAATQEEAVALLRTVEESCSPASMVDVHPAARGSVEFAELLVGVLGAFTDGGRRPRPGLGRVAETAVFSAPVTFAMLSVADAHTIEPIVRAGRWSGAELAAASELHPDIAGIVAREVVVSVDGFEPAEVTDWALGYAPLLAAVSSESDRSYLAGLMGASEPMCLRVGPRGSVRHRLVSAAAGSSPDTLSALWALADSFTGTPDMLVDVAASVAA